MKQKRKIIITGVLFFIIIVFGVYYLTADNQKKADSSDGWICAKGTEGMTSIAINSGKGSQTLSFTREESVWMGDDGSSYDNDCFASYAAVLGYMRTEESLDVSKDAKSEYGIDDSSYIVKVTYDDGETFEYILGKEIRNLGMYLSADQGNSVCLVDSRRAGDIMEMVQSLYDVALNHIKFDEIRGISLYSPKHGTLSMNRSESPRAGGDFYWNIFSPFAWIADTEVVDTLIEGVEEINVLKRTDSTITSKIGGLDAEEENLPSLTFYDTYDNQMTVYVGREEGDYVYCKTNYLDDIYMIHKDILKIINIEVKDLIDPSLYYYEIPSVETCTMNFGEMTHVLEAKWETSEHGDKRGQRYFLDDNVITGAEYKSLVSWFKETEITKVAVSSTEKGTVLGTITVDRLSPPYEQTMTFREVEGDGQLVQVDMEHMGTAYIGKNEFDKLRLSF